MEFLTLDMELADRILPSICSISIMQWEDDKIKACFHTLIDPDCEIEPFFNDRHGLTNADLLNSPALRTKWIRIYDILEGQTIFAHNANRTMQALAKRAAIDYLNMPDCKFIDTASICRRCFPGMKDYRLPNITEKLNITDVHNNSFVDAQSVGIIVNKALKEKGVKDYKELFEKTGFVGGQFKDKVKTLFRARKNKELGIYEAKFYDYANRTYLEGNVSI